MGSGATSGFVGRSFDGVPESNSPPRKKTINAIDQDEEMSRQPFDVINRSSSHGKRKRVNPSPSLSSIPGLQRSRQQVKTGNGWSRKKWWRSIPPEAFHIACKLDEQLSLQLDSQASAATVIQLADSLNVPISKRDEWAKNTNIPPVAQFQLIFVEPPPAEMTGTKAGNLASTRSVSLRSHKTELGNMFENLRLLDDDSSSPATKRALLKMVVSILVGGQSEKGMTSENLKLYCQRTRLRTLRLAAYDIGLIKDQLSLRIRDNERFQEELGPLIRIIESGEKLDPSAKRAILREILRDAKSLDQVTTPVKKAAEEVGEIRFQLPSRQPESSSIDSSTLVHTDTLIALLACLEDVAQLTPAEIRAVLMNLFKMISTSDDINSFESFIMNTKMRCVWNASLLSGLVIFSPITREYLFTRSVLGSSDVGITLPK